MEKWLDSFSRWPATNQLIFSVCAMIFAVVILFLLGFFLILLFGRRGKQPTQYIKENPMQALNELLTMLADTPTPAALRGRSVPRDPLAYIDWKEEQRRMTEEHKRRTDADEVDLGGTPTTNETEATRLAPRKRK